jgi:RNA polymerase sigma-70 factor (ECF subfamily)
VLELIRACAESNDGEAWTEFVSRFQRPISLSIVRTAQQWGGIPRQVIDDLVQETYVKLCADRCRLLLEFAVQHPEAVSGYIKVIAANVARDHFKALHSMKRGPGEVAQSLEGLEPKAYCGALDAQEAVERQILLKQVDRCLEACSEGTEQERDRLIFWLYYQQGMSAKAIASLPAIGLSAKGVESAIFRLTRMVREKVVRLREKSRSANEGEKGFSPAESYFRKEKPF